jgi:hypothetical protein
MAAANHRLVAKHQSFVKVRGRDGFNWRLFRPAGTHPVRLHSIFIRSLLTRSVTIGL